MLRMIEVERIDRGTNVRNERDEGIQELADDIERRGLLQPIVVTPRAGGRYECVAGHRRLEAVRRIGDPLIECNVLELSGLELLSAQVAENVHRKDMSAYELVAVFDSLKRQGMSQSAIARAFGRSPSWVSWCYAAAAWLDRYAEEHGGALPDDLANAGTGKVIGKIRAEREKEGTVRAYRTRRTHGGPAQGASWRKNRLTYVITCHSPAAEAALEALIDKEGWR